MSITVELEYEYPATVGEGPIWDCQHEELIWIDVLEGQIFFYSPLTKSQRIVSVNDHVGAVAFDQNYDLVIAQRDGISQYSRSSNQISYIKKVIESPDIRFNDGSVDKFGRFVVGSMGYEPNGDTGTLYSYSLYEELKVLLPKVGISNGICWNSDSTRMYYIDSLTQSIQCFGYDLENGEISNGRELVKFPESEGTPDGMTIDTEGNLWVAMWGGAQIVQLNPSGQIMRRVPLPVTNVTSLTFGGPELNILYITTARYSLSDAMLEKEPLAGSLFKIEGVAQGFLENCMK